MKLSASHISLILKNILDHYFPEEKSSQLANIFLQAELDGVSTHGLARFPRFIREIDEGFIKLDTDIEKIKSFGGWEMWSGNAGPGPLSALHCTNRVVDLAKTHGIACVGLRNTNHWLRPGFYAKHAADRGCAFIAWSNTMPNMRAHGASKTSLSNLPITIGLPKDSKNEHLVLADLALSQFSYGKLSEFEKRSESLPIEGGYDQQSQLTKDPKAIHRNHSASAIGLWKGSALSIVLDLLAAFLTGGRSVYEIGTTEGEQNVSQVYIAIALDQLWSEPEYSDRLIELKTQLKAMDAQVRIPGEKILEKNQDHLNDSVFVDGDIWREIMSLGARV